DRARRRGRDPAEPDHARRTHGTAARRADDRARRRRGVLAHDPLRAADRVTRVAIIGTGFWGAKLAEAVGRSSLELAACYSRSAARCAEFGGRFGCEAAASYESALDAADAVVLATPKDEHEAKTLAAAARGKHVFVGKP